MRRDKRVLVVGVAVAFAGFFGSLSAQENAPDRVVLPGGPLGPVSFSHLSHQVMTDCTACHHASRPEMPLSSPYQPCADCHTATPTAPMLTRIRDAFHDAPAQSGTCVDCHATEAAAGKSVPLKCAECHKRGESPPRR